MNQKDIITGKSMYKDHVNINKNYRSRIMQ